MPNGPTTLGPLRICTAAQILRSARITTATDNIKTRHSSTMKVAWLRNQPQAYGSATPSFPNSQVQNWISAILFRRHLAGAGDELLAAFGHGLARPRDRIGEVIIADRGGERAGAVQSAFRADSVPGGTSRVGMDRGL